MHPLIEYALKNHTLSHAILFVAKGEGFLESEIKKIATVLLGSDKESATRIMEQQHPDFLITRGEKIISIDAIREGQKEMSAPPTGGVKRIWWIDGAQKLRTEGQNALLKILEEPPEYLHIFLSVPWENTLLPTILSRCQLVRYESRGEIEKRDVDFVFDMLKNVFEQGPFEVMKAFVGGKDRSLLEDIFIMSEILRDFAVYECTGQQNLLKYPKKIDMIKKYTKRNKNYERLVFECLRVAEGLERNVNGELSLEHILLTIWEEIQ